MIENKKRLHPTVYILLTLVVVAALAYIYKTYFHGATFIPTISEPANVERAADAIVDKDANVVAIQIVRVILERNSRYISYTKINNPEVKKLYETFLSDRITAQVPFFTDDHVQNLRMVELLNHEYSCAPYKDTISYKFVPEVSKYVSTVCALSVPPYYGEFVGIIGVFLKNPPTEIEKELIRLDIAKLSTEVYKSIKN